MLCTFGFVNDVMISSGSTSGLTLPQHARCSVVYGLTPLLHGVGSVLLKTTTSPDKTSDS